MKTLPRSLVGAIAVSAAPLLNAAVIDFTGGTVHLAGGGTAVTVAGNDLYQPTDYYVESGFRLDFINANPANGEYIGDYYGADATGAYNDVIHGHWAPNHGDMSAIEITKEGGGTFDLNYFILTSNSDFGGGPASGNELAFIEAWVGGVMTHRQLLPADNWGWDGVHNPGALQNDPQIFLGPEFDAVDLVRFTVDNDVYCFGMDEFYIDEPAPPNRVPDGGSALVLFGMGMSTLAGLKKLLRA